MRPIRGEPVEVWLRHGRPARFVWRGRMYTVLFVRDKRTVPGSAQPEAGGAPAKPGVLAGRGDARAGRARQRLRALS